MPDREQDNGNDRIGWRLRAELGNNKKTNSPAFGTPSLKKEGGERTDGTWKKFYRVRQRAGRMPVINRQLNNQDPDLSCRLVRHPSSRRNKKEARLHGNDAAGTIFGSMTDKRVKIIFCILLIRCR